MIVLHVYKFESLSICLGLLLTHVIECVCEFFHENHGKLLLKNAYDLHSTFEIEMTS